MHLGLLWTALEPAFTFILLYLVFTSIRFRPGENFAIYLLTGIILYHIFARGTLAGLVSLQNAKGILQSFSIRKEFFPISVGLATCILMIVQIGVFFTLMLPFQYQPPITIIFYPLILLLLITLIIGISYILSAVFVYIKDLQLIWAVIVHALFFVSPIFWYVKDADGVLLLLYNINPIGQIIEFAHHLIVFGTVPSAEQWLETSLIVFVIFIGGFFIFQKLEKKIAEEI